MGLFQSAPGTSAGRYTAAYGAVCASEEVSIRARHECRAIRGSTLDDNIEAIVSIRARHECRAIPRAHPEHVPP